MVEPLRLNAIIGLIISFVVFFASVVTALGGIDSFWDQQSFFIVVGGTLGASLVSIPFAEHKLVIKEFITRCLRKKKVDYNLIIQSLIILARERRKGTSAFDRSLAKMEHPFLKYGGGLIFWAEAEISEDEFRNILETHSRSLSSKSRKVLNALKTMAKFPPAFGMMGTVLGLIALLQSLGSPDAKSQIGPAMAIALVTTLYGIALNNLTLIPIAESMKGEYQEDALCHSMIIEGFLLIQQKKPTKYIEEKLNAFLTDQFNKKK